MIRRIINQLRIATGMKAEPYPQDFSMEEIEIVHAVQPFTLTSPERIVSLVRNVHYIIGNNIPGAFVECGVWRGGSMMAAALALRSAGCVDRELYLFDTFTGMSPPTARDYNLKGVSASSKYKRWAHPDSSGGSRWVYAPLEEVQHSLYRTGYPPERIHFIQGRVEDTLPEQAPEMLALLRLDTDWYESTLHELVHLFPRLVPGGVLIVDDYGHWMGQRDATDEYLSENQIRLLLQRIDYTNRTAVKL